MCLCYYEITCPIEQQAHIFFGQPFTTNVREDALVLALKVSYKHELWVSSGFSNTISICPGSVSKFLHCNL